MAFLFKCPTRKLPYIVQLSVVRWSSSAAAEAAVPRIPSGTDVMARFFKANGKECVQLNESVFTTDDLQTTASLNIVLIEHWLRRGKLTRSQLPRFYLMNGRERAWAKAIWYKDCISFPFYVFYPHYVALSRLLMLAMLISSLYLIRNVYFYLVPNREDNIFYYEHWQKVREEHYKHKLAHSAE